MIGAALSISKLLNRIVSDYPQARAKLVAHSGKRLDIHLGPLTAALRVNAYGEFEIVGLGQHEDSVLTITVPLVLLPRLARRDLTAFADVAFAGDSEFASTLSTIARNATWDVEEDLSKIIGDIAAHRAVTGAQAASAWARDAQTRVTVQLAEYLTEERHALITQSELHSLASSNEALRDAIARAEARLALLVN